ncbi:MAG: UDP-galactopyranose mutase, partial [Gemmataceae bacterium]|nr:UDP-galactopyranose mutase [Gemmataceae bacterium]
MRDSPGLVVFSHLRWDFVWQRPQHLITRLAASRRVLFVEEPVPGASEPRWELQRPTPNLTICRPHLPAPAHGFDDSHLPSFRPLLRQLLEQEGATRPVLWFYTPLALPFGDGIDARAVVYDCMDELSAFKNAPPTLAQREADLLRRADVVFTGGPSLYRARQGKHPNIHCFPSSVDAGHFGQAARPMIDPPDQIDAPRPRLGFFGVIDERLDVPLIDAVAAARPDWQLVMVGPVVKIDPATLPRR